MFLVTVAIEHTARAAFPPGGVEPLVRAIRAAATPDDGLEHVSAREGPDGPRIGIFCLASDRTTAEKNARRICRNALERQPEFAGWHLSPANS